MKKQVQEYPGKDVIVRYDPRVCTHAGECIQRLPGVFNLMKRPWIDPNGAEGAAIIETIKACPSGALSFEKAA